MEDYQVIHEIGSGAYGSVFSVRNKNEYFALKLSLLNDNESLNPGIIREWIFAKSFVQSKNVCPILKKWSDRKHSFFLMPLYDCTLYEYAKNNAISFEDFQTIAANMQNGIMNMHKQKWLHRDLKPENVYMHRNGDIVIGDFNLVRFDDMTSDTRGDDSLGTTHVCTLWSRAPELVWGQVQGKNVIHTGPEIDTFSFGILLLSLVRGDYVFGKHVEGAGNTKEIRYLNGLLSFCGVDDEIRKHYDLLESQIFDDFKHAGDRFLAYMPSAWAPEERKETALLITSLLDPVPSRRRKIETCVFSKGDFNKERCETIANKRQDRATGVHGPGLYAEERIPSTMAQLAVIWSVGVSKNIPLPIAMHAVLASKRLPIFRSSSITCIFNMLHMIHRNQNYNETFIEVSSRCFLDCLLISTKLWNLCKEIENEPFLCCLLAAWIATRHDIPSRQDLDADKTIIMIKGVEDFFNRKNTRTMLESWRRLN